MHQYKTVVKATFKTELYHNECCVTAHKPQQRIQSVLKKIYTLLRTCKGHHNHL